MIARAHARESGFGRRAVGDDAAPDLGQVIVRPEIAAALVQRLEIGVVSKGDLLQAASYGFAYRAKPKARAAANGWVDRGDLLAVLSLLGIPREEWVGS